MSEKIEIRWASEQDASELARLARESGNAFENFELDWSHPHVGTSWLVAQVEDGSLLGAVQILAGFPVGRIETLMLSESLGQKARALTTTRLADRGLLLLRAVGCQLVTTTISTENPGFLKVVENEGWVATDVVHRLVKRLV